MFKTQFHYNLFFTKQVLNNGFNPVYIKVYSIMQLWYHTCNKSFVVQHETMGQMSKTSLWKENYISKNKV